jgi:predicted nucleic acid-binding protein
MSAEIFLDTNVLVYLIDDADGRRQRVARKLVRDVMGRTEVCISWQVVQEFLNVATHKMKPRLSEALTRRYFDTILVPLCKVWPAEHIYARALELQAAHRLNFYDSLIIAAALDAGCSTLYSEDLQTGRKFGDLTIENPFAV